MRKHILAISMLVSALPAMACGDNFCRGTEVLYGNETGYVVEAFSNGKVKVNWDSYSEDSVVNRSTLATRKECFNNICEGASVIYSSGDQGRVLAVYSNGKMRIDWVNYTEHSFVSSSTLSTETQCVNDICSGNRVIYGAQELGRVLKVFSNGKALIDWDNFSEHSSVNITQLSKGYRCSGALCRGERVIYGNETGSVVEIFRNGSVVVDWDNYSSNSAVKITTLGFALEDCYN